MESGRNRPALKTAAAAAACKAARGMLRITRHGGTTLPGRAALFFDKEILAHASEGVKTIVVTGTNGKTSTSRMLETALSRTGEAVLANRSGANLLWGISAEFAASTDLLGRPGKRLAVIECDEGALKQVTPLLKPDVILVTNLFRDQLDRYGEVMNTLDQLREGIRRSPQSILCLNADCSLTSSLARDVPNRVVYYGLDVPVGGQEDPEISDAKYCIVCGSRYSYTYHTYAHLGGFYCPVCGYRRMRPRIAVTDIRGMDARGSDVTMELRSGTDALGTDARETDAAPELQCGENGKDANGRSPDENILRWSAHIGLPAVYNIYNAAGALCAFEVAGFDPETMIHALADTGSSFGRMETFDLSGVPVRMVLVKNPAGCDQALTYLAGLKEDYEVVLCLNDETADGHDISWIWDVDYEKLAADPFRKQILVSGSRGEDLQLRLKYAGIPEKEITLIHGWKELADRMQESRYPVYALPNYTTMLALRGELAGRTGKKGFWEG